MCGASITFKKKKKPFVNYLNLFANTMSVIENKIFAISHRKQRKESKDKTKEVLSALQLFNYVPGIDMKTSSYVLYGTGPRTLLGLQNMGCAFCDLCWTKTNNSDLILFGAVLYWI